MPIIDNIRQGDDILARPIDRDRTDLQVYLERTPKLVPLTLQRTWMPLGA